MLANKIYYAVKPLVPRRLQIALRRALVHRRMKKSADSWPIDPRASKLPEDWAGWPQGKKFALVLTHDVDTSRGQDRCRILMDAEKRLGFRSSFNFVPERYAVSESLRHELVQEGFEVGVHGLYHDGKYYESREVFRERAGKINRYLRDWQAVGFRTPSMLHNLEWLSDLDIEYDASTFDTDPFEPQPDGMATIFPFWVNGLNGRKGYVELPYTLPQDFTLYVLLGEKDATVWRTKVDWIAEHGGMALLNVHPDYISTDGSNRGVEEYPISLYEDLLQYVRSQYDGAYWHVLPKDMARYWKEQMVLRKGSSGSK